jgi:hypothetical protein
MLPAKLATYYIIYIIYLWRIAAYINVIILHSNTTADAIMGNNIAILTIQKIEEFSDD